MDYSRREYFVSRICSGYIKINNPKVNFKVFSPTISLQYEANEIYMNTFELAVEEGIFDDIDIYSYLVDTNQWTDEQEKLLEELPKHIEKWQIEMYNAAVGFKSETLAKLRKYLKKAREEYEKLYYIRHKYDSYTCNGAAYQAKSQFIIENCTKTMSGKKFKFEKLNIIEVLNEYNKNVISSLDFRLLARTSPWNNIWNSIKMNGTPFASLGVNITGEQQLLLMWTRMYENIHESPECPSDEIIEDDDLLDGWLLVQRQKREEDKKGKLSGPKLSDKVSNSEEIFLVAETQQDANKIYNTNTSQASKIVRERLKRVEELKEVKYHEFSDAKQKKVIQLTQQHNALIKKGKR